MWINAWLEGFCGLVNNQKFRVFEMGVLLKIFSDSKDISSETSLRTEDLGHYSPAYISSWILGPPLTRSVTLYRSLKLSVPQPLDRIEVGIKCVNTSKVLRTVLGVFRA